MDKKVFLLDKESYTEEMVSSLSEKDLEEWLAEKDHDGNYTIVKIDANGYNSAEEAIINEMPFVDIDGYYIFAFGF